MLPQLTQYLEGDLLGGRHFELSANQPLWEPWPHADVFAGTSGRLGAFDKQNESQLLDQFRLLAEGLVVQLLYLRNRYLLKLALVVAHEELNVLRRYQDAALGDLLVSFLLLENHPGAGLAEAGHEVGGRHGDVSRARVHVQIGLPGPRRRPVIAGDTHIFVFCRLAPIGQPI